MATIATLRAIQTGQAVRTTTVRHVHISDRPFVVIPLNLAGEACAPLAVMCGTERTALELLVVPQPRNRDQRFAFTARLAELMLRHVESCRRDTEAYEVGRSEGKERRERYIDAPQILVPNPGGVAFVRLLGRSTRLRRTDGLFAVNPSVPTIGKWLTWFGERAEFPDTNVLLAMTEMLSDHWATGQSSLEDRNLAALLAWIDPPRGMDGSTAALEAEDPTRFPPAGPTTDPVFDQRELEPAINAYEKARTDAQRTGAERILTAALRGQLAPTWEAMWRGINLLRSVPPGGHVDARWTRDRIAFTAFAEYLESDGRPQPRRDNAARATRRLARLEDAATRYQCERAFDDPLVMAEYELDGTAFTGTVIARNAERTIPGKRTPVFRPTLTLRVDQRPDGCVDDELTSPARPGQKATILTIREGPAGYEVELELSGGMGRRPPAPAGTLPGVGDEVCYTTLSPSAYSGVMPSDDEIPWTHGGPPTPYEPTIEDAEEEWQ